MTTSPQSMSDLPELPEPMLAADDYEADYYTADQMHEYGHLCRATAEQAGKVEGFDWGMFPCYMIDRCEGEVVSEEAIQQWVADMLKNPRYAKPTQPVATQMPVAYVGDMRTSAGMEYYVCVEVGGRRLTPQRYDERWKAEFDVAEWQSLFTGSPRPDILAYGPENETTELAAHVSPSREVEALVKDTIKREMAAWSDASQRDKDIARLALTSFSAKFDKAIGRLAPVQEKAP